MTLTPNLSETLEDSFKVNYSDKDDNQNTLYSVLSDVITLCNLSPGNKTYYYYYYIQIADATQ